MHLIAHSGPPRQPRLLVLGDALFDREIYGSSKRQAPDSTAPVIDVGATCDRAGGAGLLAGLASSIGAEVCLATGGSAADLDRLRTMLPTEVTVIGINPQVSMPTKTRVWSGNKMVARIDHAGQPWRDEDVIQVPYGVEEFRPDVVVVSDYGLGSTSSLPIRDLLKRLGAEVPLIWDPHPRGAVPVPDCLTVTPSMYEVAHWRDGDGEPSLAQLTSAAREARVRWSARSVTLTMSYRGVLLDERDAAGPSTHLPIDQPVLGVDACGAGDFFAAQLAIAVAGGEALEGATRTAMGAVRPFLMEGGVRAHCLTTGQTKSRNS